MNNIIFINSQDVIQTHLNKGNWNKIENFPQEGQSVKNKGVEWKYFSKYTRARGTWEQTARKILGVVLLVFTVGFAYRSTRIQSLFSANEGVIFAVKKKSDFISNSFPSPIKKIVVDFAISSPLPIYLTKARLQERHQTILNTAKTCREAYELLKNELQKTTEIFHLMQKYKAYDDYDKQVARHEKWKLHNPNMKCDKGFNWDQGVNWDPGGPPQLLDALSTGCRLHRVKSTFKVYSKEIEEDIKKLVTIMPMSLHSKMGYLRCGYNETPLSLACFNKNVPIEVVKFLFEKGADPEDIILRAFKSTKVIDHMKFNVSSERYTKLQELFNMYTEVTSKIGFGQRESSRS